MSLKKLYCCAALALLTVARVNGATFFTDQFNYANGQLTTFDGTMAFAGDNVSGGAWATFSPLPPSSINPGSITVSNGQAILNEPSTEDASRSIPNAGTDFMTAGETWYFAAKVTVMDQRATPATTPVQPEYFMLVKDTSPGGLRSRLYVNDPSTGTGGAGFRFAMSASSGGIANAVNWGTDLSFGQEYTLVGSYEFDTGFSRLWVNPSSQASTSVQATTAPNMGTFISALGMRQAFFNAGALNTQIKVNAVSLADSFSDALAGVVPEPTSAVMALASFAGLSLARRRRR